MAVIRAFKGSYRNLASKEDAHEAFKCTCVRVNLLLLVKHADYVV